MKTKKILVTAMLIAVAAATSITAFAASYKTPAEAVAGLTNKPVTEIVALHQDGKTYGSIAKDNGVLEQFKQDNLEIKKEIVQQRVDEGKLTAETAAEVIEKIEQNLQNCDGSGTGEKIGQQYGLGLGNGSGNGNGQGMGMGSGNKGNGQGRNCANCTVDSTTQN